MEQAKACTLWIVRTLTLAFVVLVAGCGSHPDPMHGDESFTLTQRQAIESGAEWLGVHSGLPRVEIVWDLPHPADDAPLERMTIVRRRPTEGDGTHPGWCENAGIELDSAMDGEWLSYIAAHEFGHFEGYQHHAGRGVMSVEPAGAVFEWTPADAATRSLK